MGAQRVRCAAVALLAALAAPGTVGAAAPAIAASQDRSDDTLTLLEGAPAVETWVRLKGDAAGTLTYEWVSGAAWGMPDGALAEPLFRFESVTVRRFERIGEAHYLERSYACRLYRDSASGAFVDRLRVPYTGREVALPTRCSPGPTLRYTAQRVTLEPDIGFRSSALGVSMRLQRLALGDRVAFRRDARSEYRSRASGELRRETSLDAFVVDDAGSLRDPRRTSYPTTYQWTSVTQWMVELGAGLPPGRMLWSIHGRKFARPDELPADFRAALERAVPDALTRRFD